jgi:hypothetical protein
MLKCIGLFSSLLVRVIAEIFCLSFLIPVVVTKWNFTQMQTSFQVSVRNKILSLCYLAVHKIKITLKLYPLLIFGIEFRVQAKAV